MGDAENEVVLVQEHARGVFLLTINRPKRRNALNLAVKRRLDEIVSMLESDNGVRVVVISGANGSFAAGTDIDEMWSMSPTEHTLEATDRMFVTLRRFTKPLIAAVEGFALGGGCELALTCDLILAGEAARFGLPEIRVGVMPGAGGTQRLLRTIGKYRTMRLVLTGEHITAPEAYAMGLLSEVTADGQALQRALQLAETIASMPPLATRAIKEVVQLGVDGSLEAALLLERKSFQVLFSSQDQKEGMRAFLEKRSPEFLGK